MIYRYRHKFDRTFVDAMQYFHGVNHVTLRDWLHDFGASSLMIYDKDLGSYCMLVKEYPSTLRREQKQKHMTKFKYLLTEGVYVLKHSDDTFTICNTKLFRATYIKIV